MIYKNYCDDTDFVNEFIQICVNSEARMMDYVSRLRSARDKKDTADVDLIDSAKCIIKKEILDVEYEINEEKSRIPIKDKVSNEIQLGIESHSDISNFKIKTEEIDLGIDNLENSTDVAEEKHGGSVVNSDAVKSEAEASDFEMVTCEADNSLSDNLLKHKDPLSEEAVTAVTKYNKNARASVNIVLYDCSICHKIFKRTDHLASHLRIHPEKISYECQLCDKTFIHKLMLTKHMRKHTDQTFDCSVCDKKFPKKDRLKIHMRTHTKERPYECFLCGKKFTLRHNLTTHIRIHTQEKPYKCSVCLRRFNRTDRLTVHMRIHTGERPYECEVCAKRFNRKHLLSVHQRLHTGEKPYECSVCAQKFAWKSGLIVHMRRHTKERPYECKTCLQKFICSSILTRHRLRWHSDD